MYIPQEVRDLIIDQLASVNEFYMRRRKFLRAASLVSTAWVNRSQHHLFSTVVFSQWRTMQEWCSRIEPGSEGISRHVRALGLIQLQTDPPLVADVPKTAFPHLTSFRNLQSLDVHRIDLNLVPLDVLIPIISSFARTLRQLLWTQEHDTAHRTWKTISTIANLLPNLVDLLLSDYSYYDSHGIAYPPLPRISLSRDLELEHADLLAFKHFRFQELHVDTSVPNSLSLFEYCRSHLRALDLKDMGIVVRELTLTGSRLE